jgi:hypothetical protein
MTELMKDLIKLQDILVWIIFVLGYNGAMADIIGRKLKKDNT